MWRLRGLFARFGVQDARFCVSFGPVSFTGTAGEEKNLQGFAKSLLVT